MFGMTRAQICHLCAAATAIVIALGIEVWANPIDHFWRRPDAVRSIATITAVAVPPLPANVFAAVPLPPIAPRAAHVAAATRQVVPANSQTVFPWLSLPK